MPPHLVAAHGNVSKVHEDVAFDLLGLREPSHVGCFIYDGVVSSQIEIVAHSKQSIGHGATKLLLGEMERKE